MTAKGYRAISVDVSAPRLLSDRLTLVGRGRNRYFPQEDYFGIGPKSPESDRANYLLEEREFGGIAAFRATPWLTWSAKLARLDPRIGQGTDERYPTIGAEFSDATAPDSKAASVPRNRHARRDRLTRSA